MTALTPAQVYGSDRWRRLRLDVYARQNGNCADCGELCRSPQAHHIERVGTPAGAGREFDPDNIEVLCAACHTRKHEHEDRCDRNGLPRKVPADWRAFLSKRQKEVRHVKAA